MALQRKARACNVRSACAGEKTDRHAPLRPGPSPAWKHFKGRTFPSPPSCAASPLPCALPLAHRANNGPLCSQEEIITSTARCQGEVRLCPITVWLKGRVSFLFISLYPDCQTPAPAQAPRFALNLGPIVFTLSQPTSDSTAVCSSALEREGKEAVNSDCDLRVLQPTRPLHPPWLGQ